MLAKGETQIDQLNEILKHYINKDRFYSLNFSIQNYI